MFPQSTHDNWNGSPQLDAAPCTGTQACNTSFLNKLNSL